MIGDVEYHENTPALHLWDTTSCRGDGPNDWSVDDDDVDALELFLDDPNDYDAAFPGLLGSAPYHFDLNDSNTVNAVDLDWLNHFATPEGDCCFTGLTGANPYGACLMDTNTDGEVGLADLAEVLGNYGTTSGALLKERDFEVDGDVDLTDL